jgi:hypothetical protein
MRGFGERRGMKGAGVVVAPRACHTRIAVPEKHLPVDAKDLARPHELRRPHLTEPWAHLCRVHVVDVALLAARCSEQDDADALVMSTQHDSARRDAFIVGVCVNEQKRGHAEPR